MLQRADTLIPVLRAIRTCRSFCGVEPSRRLYVMFLRRSIAASLEAAAACACFLASKLCCEEYDHTCASISNSLSTTQAGASNPGRRSLHLLQKNLYDVKGRLILREDQGFLSIDFGLLREKENFGEDAQKERRDRERGRAC